MDQVRTMRDVLADIDVITKRAFAQAKKAGYAPSETVGGDGSDMPGSENDKPVDQSAKQPNPQVADGLPSGAQSSSGASSPEQKREGASALDATQPAAKVDKTPLVSADVNAEPKTGASKIANDLLSSIRDYQKKTAAPAAPAAPAAAPKVAAQAPVAGFEMTQDVLAKIASVILETEDGIKFAELALTKAAGAEAARETFNFLQKQAAHAQGAADAEALIAQQVQLQKNAEAEYYQGAADAEALIATMAKKGMAAGAPVPAVNSKIAQLKKLAQEIADESAGDAVGAMESMPQDQEIGPDELVQALEELVQEGQIQPEAAQALLQALSSGDAGGAEDETGVAGGGDAGGAPGGAEEGGAAAEPAPQAPAEEEQAKDKKEAATKNAQALIAAIQRHKANQGK